MYPELRTGSTDRSKPEEGLIMNCVVCGGKSYGCSVPGVGLCPGCTNERSGTGDTFLLTESLRDAVTGQVFTVGAMVPTSVVNDPDVVPISEMR